MKPVLVFGLVLMLASSGWIASASASESLPGDALWHVKLATEKTQIAIAGITGDAEKNVSLQIKFAARRAEEIKTVSTKDTFDATEKAKRTEEGLKKLQENIASLDTTVTSEEQVKDIGKHVKDVNDATAQISNTLKEVAVSVAGSETGSDAVAKQVVAVKQVVDEVALNAVKTAVEHAGTDEERIAAEGLVEEKIVTLLSDVDTVLEKNEAVKALASGIDETVSLDIANDIGSVVTSSVATDVSSTVGLADTVGVASSSPVAIPSTTVNTTTPVQSTPQDGSTTRQTIATILTNVNNTSAQVTNIVAEVKALLDANDLSAALEKAKELRRIAAASEQKNIDITRAVKEATAQQPIANPVAPTTVPATGSTQAPVRTTTPETPTQVTTTAETKDTISAPAVNTPVSQ